MVRRTGWALVLAGILGVVALGPFLAPYSPTASVAAPYRPPGLRYLLGTDVVGRDVLSRLLHGGWSLVAVSSLALVIAYTLGLTLGLVAGLRPRADPWLMRPVDALVVLPWFLVLAVTATALGAGAAAVLLTSALAAAPWIARIVRTAVHDIAGAGYIESARARGEPLWRIAVVEILPNLRAVVLADAGVRLSGVISIVAVGGFLGLGLRPPAPDWALMITENRPGFGLQPWSVLAPALLIMVLVVSANMLSDRVLAPPRHRTGAVTPAPDTGEGLRTGQLTVRNGAGRVLLEDVSVRLAPGAGLAVVGPSGAGKTTFVSAVLGALPPGLAASGTVTIGRGGPHRRAVGFVPQDPATGLNPALRIGTSIAEIARASGLERTGDEVVAALRRVGLPTGRAFRHRFPHELSGGQQQRVLVAMAMIGDPALVVLDEPTTGLDLRARTDLVEMLGAVRREAGTAFVVITHDLPGVASLVDDVLELDAGRVAAYRPIRASDNRAAAVTVRKPEFREEEPILRVEALTCSYRSRTVVDGVSFDLVPGSCLALTGVSGAGKTTVARALTGLHPAAGGTIRLAGTLLPPGTDERTTLQRRALQLIPQNPATALNPAHRVGTQIRRPLTLLRGMDTATADLEVIRLLTEVGLDPDLASRRPGELSGGQQQRVALARALAADPQILICDEITASLDAKSQQVVIDLLDRLRRDGPALLVISHQSAVLDQLADAVLDMDDPNYSTTG
ncbi:ABC transporter ATP-binding protein/permease [Nocardia sp. NPDC003345]